jgi:hypothetical protein
MRTETRGMRKYLTLACVVVAVAVARRSGASPVEFTFGGTLLRNDCPGFDAKAGDSWQLTYVFDSTSPDSNPHWSVGDYFDDPISAFRLTVGKTTVQATGIPGGVLKVQLGETPAYDYLATVNLASGEHDATLTLSHLYHPVFATDALPLCGDLHIADFPDSAFRVSKTLTDLSGCAAGTVTSHACRTGSDGCECGPSKAAMTFHSGLLPFCSCVGRFDRTQHKLHKWVGKILIKYTGALTKCFQKSITILARGKKISGVSACLATADQHYAKAFVGIDAPACIEPENLASGARLLVQSYNRLVYCNQNGSPGALPAEFSGGYLPASGSGKIELAADKLLRKYGTALGTCLLKGLAAAASGDVAALDACFTRARSKVLAGTWKLDFSGPGFGEGTGCYEGLNDFGGLTNQVEQLVVGYASVIFCGSASGAFVG